MKIRQYLPDRAASAISRSPACPSGTSPDVGEMHYPYLFDVIDAVAADCGWQGWIGCEYRPRAGTSAGLGWLRGRGVAGQALPNSSPSSRARCSARLHRAFERGADPGLLQGRDGRVGRGHPWTSRAGARWPAARRAPCQFGRASEGADGQLLRLRGRQAHRDAGLHHGFEEIEHVGRPRAGQRGHGVQLRLLFTHSAAPVVAMTCSTCVRSAAADRRRARRGRSCPGPPAPACWAWRARCARRPASARCCRCGYPLPRLSAARWLSCARNGRGGFGEHLRLDRPDHEAGVGQRRAGLLQRLHAVVGQQFGPGLGNRVRPRAHAWPAGPGAPGRR